jgi:hypothetical protein
MLRKAAPISRKAIGAKCRPCTHTMPQRLKTFSGACPSRGLSTSTLIRPMRGSARKIQEAE